MKKRFLALSAVLFTLFSTTSLAKGIETESNDTVEYVTSSAEYSEYSAGGLESKYAPFDSLPEVRDDIHVLLGERGNYTCVELEVYNALLQAAEIQCYKQGQELPLSLAQLGYFSWNSVLDPLGGISNDINRTNDGWTWYEHPSKLQYAMRSMEKWIGPVSEDKLPFTNIRDYCQDSFSPDISLSTQNDVLHMQNYREYRLDRAEDRLKVKQWIKDKGAVVCQYTQDAEYNEDNFTYYYNNEPSYVFTYNYGVIVGWDDNFSKEKFPEQNGGKPSRNGAWLVRTNYTNPKYQSIPHHYNNAYVWISYEDRFMAGYDPEYPSGESTVNRYGVAIAADFEPADNYKYNYQYDGSIMDYNYAFSMGVAGANIFTAASNDYLTAAAIYLFKENENYRLSVYKNCNSDNPESGELVASQVGRADAKGYYTVPLENPVYLTTGTKFSVVFELWKDENDPDQYNAIVYEDGVTDPMFTNASAWGMYILPRVDYGQSFVRQVGPLWSSEWYDCAKRHMGNVRIKAFTGDLRSGQIPSSSQNQGLSGLQPSADGNWYLYNNGNVCYDYNGLYCDSIYGWWLVTNGRVAFEYNDLYCDSQYGWWKINGGSVDFGYTGLYFSPSCGWWLIGGGSVAFYYNDLWLDLNYGWWKVNGGSVDFAYNDLFGSPQYGWWKINGGTVDFGYTGLYESFQYGWWLIGGGTVCFDYYGMWNDPVYGPWNIHNGAVVF